MLPYEPVFELMKLLNWNLVPIELSFSYKNKNFKTESTFSSDYKAFFSLTAVLWKSLVSFERCNSIKKCETNVDFCLTMSDTDSISFKFSGILNGLDDPHIESLIFGVIPVKSSYQWHIVKWAYAILY